MKREWRVRWKRGGPTVYRLYQSEAAARRCATRQETASEDLKKWGEPGVDWPHAPAPITWGPVVDSREVGAWE